MKKKKLHFFKNDPFDIKYKIFNKQIKSAINESIKLRCEALAICLKAIIAIGYPTDIEEFEMLEDFVQRYDKHIQELEEKVVSRARQHIETHRAICDCINNKEE